MSVSTTIADRWLVGKISLVDKEGFRKHYGPGPHPGTGTSQDVHGSGGGKQPVDDSPIISSRDPRALTFEVGHKELIARWEYQLTRDKEYRDAAQEMMEHFNAIDDRYSWPPFHQSDEEYMGDGSVAWIMDDEEVEWIEEHYPDMYEELLHETPNEFWERHAARQFFERMRNTELDFKTAIVDMAILDDWLDTAKPFIRVDAGVFEEILMSGEILNQLETGTSNGWFSPDGRRQVDSILYGIDPEWDDGRSPIYGYWGQESGVWAGGSPMDHMDPEAARHAETLEHYGQIAFELEDSVRATFTVGDSLDDSGIHHGSFFGSATISPDTLTGSNPGFTVGSRGYLRPSDMDGLAGNLSGSTVEQRTRYVEAQFHEAITFEDIKAVHVPRYILTDMGYDTAEEFANDHLPIGIDVEVYE